jgi:predicted SprT family Zn-dependent metalloprotease
MRKLSAKVEDLYAQSLKIWPQLRSWDKPTIGGALEDTRAGLALYFENKIQFNLIYYQAYGARFLEETPGHEIAHLINYQLNGLSVLEKPTGKSNHHGKEWKEIMWRLGLIPRALHCYDMSMIKKSQKRS